MHNHEPQNYDCPFCRIVRSANDQNFEDSEVVCYTNTVTAFLALGRWVNNPVDILIVPNNHFENIYDLPIEYAVDLHGLTRAIALALKAIYQCDGISTRQHNELAGDQDVWHYHVHITPRFIGDRFYRSKKIPFPATDRIRHAGKLRSYLSKHLSELF